MGSCLQSNNLDQHDSATAITPATADTIPISHTIKSKEPSKQPPKPVASTQKTHISYSNQVVHPETEYNLENVLIGDRRSLLIWGFIRINIESTQQFEFNKIIPEVLKILIMAYLGNYIFISKHCNILEENDGDKVIITNEAEQKWEQRTSNSQYAKLVSIKPLEVGYKHCITATLKSGSFAITDVCIGIISTPKGFIENENDVQHTPFHNKGCETAYFYYGEQVLGMNNGSLINSRVGRKLKFDNKLQTVSLNIDLEKFELRVPGTQAVGIDPIDMFRFRQYFAALAFNDYKYKELIHVEITIGRDEGNDQNVTAVTYNLV